MHKSNLKQTRQQRAEQTVGTPICLFAFVIPVTAKERCVPHGHPCTELVLSIGSKGRLIDDGRQWTYGPDEAFAYQPGTEHWVRHITSGTHICVGLIGGDAGALAPGTLKTTDAVRARFEEIGAVTRSTSPTQRQRLNLLSGLLALDLIEAQASTAVHVAQTDAATKPADPATLARTMIDERFNQPLLMGDLADALYVSPEHLRRLFRESFGTSPMHYLIRRRIEHAQHILRITDSPIHEVAARCGIDNPYYFSRLFRRITGVTATEYRKM